MLGDLDKNTSTDAYCACAMLPWVDSGWSEAIPDRLIFNNDLVMENCAICVKHCSIKCVGTNA